MILTNLYLLQVFQKIRSLLPDLAVEGFVMDFERGTCILGVIFK